MNRVKFVFAVALLVVLVLCACTAQSSRADRQRDYWPTVSWRTSSPEEQEIDSALPTDIDAYTAKNLKDFTCILLVRHGYIVYERYMTGDNDTQRKLWDATKSITSIVAGLAVRQNYIRSVDQKVVDILPELNVENGSSGSEEITIRHLLSMTAGLEPRPYQSAPDFAQIKSLFAAPLKSSPGSEFNDADVCPQLISVILTKTTERSAYEFAKDELFGPLGIENMQWQNVEGGFSDGAKGILMTPRDMAKLGYLCLNNGIWDNKQIIPPEWIQESTKVQAVYQEENKPRDKALNIDYGYLWWVNTATKHKRYWAHGYGGQTITIVPDLDIVLVNNFTPRGNGSIGPPPSIEHSNIATCELTVGYLNIQVRLGSTLKCNDPEFSSYTLRGVLKPCRFRGLEFNLKAMWSQ